MRKNVKKALFLFFLGLLLLPFIQSRKAFVPEPSLHGAFALTERPAFSKEGWLSGTFQRDFEGYVNDHLPFRNFMVRGYNQLYYSLFTTSTNSTIEIGKEGYLYEISSIEHYTGNSTQKVGAKRIAENLAKLQKVQNFLASKGKQMLVVCVPTKANFYPEYIPDRYLTHLQKETDYQTFARLASASSLHFLDFIPHFAQLKAHSPYPLFPDRGAHWSSYAAQLAIDSIVSYMEKAGGKEYRDYKTDSVIVSNVMRTPDYDLGELLNLYQTLPHQSMPYPVVSYSNDTSKAKPHVLFCGDSFYWNIRLTGVPEHLFEKPSFWYYNALVYPESFARQTKITEINYKQEIERTEAVIFLVNPANLVKTPFDFANDFMREYQIK